MDKVFQHLVSGLLLLLMATACHKQDHKSIPATKEKLTGSYKLIALKAMQGSGGEENLIDQLNECEKDDILKLNADMTAEFVDTGKQCALNGDYNCNWSFDGKKKLVIDGEENIIQRFDGYELVLSSVDYRDGKAINLISTYIVE